MIRMPEKQCGPQRRQAWDPHQHNQSDHTRQGTAFATSTVAHRPGFPTHSREGVA